MARLPGLPLQGPGVLTIGARGTGPENRAAFDEWSRRHGVFRAYGEAKYTDIMRRARLDGDAPLSVLEVGCGSGAFASAMWAPGRRIVGIEISRGLLRAARELPGPHDLRLAEGDATRLPFRNGSFDVVFSGDFLHHIPDALARALPEYARVLRTGGRFVAFEPNAADPYTRWFYRMGFAEVPTERAVDPSALRRALNASGFSAVSVTPLDLADAARPGEAPWRRTLRERGLVGFTGKALRYAALHLLSALSPGGPEARPTMLVDATKGRA